MNYRLFFFPVLFIALSALSQPEVKPNFGVVTAKDFDIDVLKYEGHPAVVLSDFGYSEIDEDAGMGYVIRFKRTRRIMILSEEGKGYGNVKINYYDKKGSRVSERIRDIEGYTYNLTNGKVERNQLDRGDVFSTTKSEYSKEKSFALPQVKVGTIIEYQYELISPYLRKPPDWEFQSRIPTIYSHYRFGIAQNFSYIYIGRGMSKFDFFNKHQRTVGSSGSSYLRTDLKETIYEFGMKDVPAFESEDYITSINDYIMKIDFELSAYYSPSGGVDKYLTTYEDMVKKQLESDYYGRFLKKSEKIAADLLEGMDLESMGMQEKIKAIREKLISVVKWSGDYSRGAEETNPKKMLQNGIGWSGEINLLFCGMLRAAGLDSYPVMLSTRQHGKIVSDFPFLSAFNNTVVALMTGESAIVLDATSSMLPYNMIPPECYNGKGLIVDKDKQNWVNLRSTKGSTKTIVLKMTLDPEEEKLDGEVAIVSTNYLAYYNRLFFDDDPDKIIEYYEPRLEDAELVISKGYENGEAPYTLGMKGSIPVERIGDDYYINPFGKFPPAENRLKAKTRNYPVDLNYKKAYIYQSEIEIPEGYFVSEKPENYTLSDDLIKISFKVSTDNNRLITKAEVNYKKDVYSSGEYSRIKHYMGKVVEHFNKTVVVGKSD